MSLPLERMPGLSPEVRRAVELHFVEDAITNLGSLAVCNKAPTTGYSREEFGGGWETIGGINARTMTLDRDLEDKEYEKTETGILVVKGTLIDPYSGKEIKFDVTDDKAERELFIAQRKTSNIDIDHVVALQEAWIKGAHAWDEEKRLTFHNDLVNLLAVDFSLNRQKGAADAATWLPPLNRARALYVARQIIIKTVYDLGVTKPEKEEMAKILKNFRETEMSVNVRRKLESGEITNEELAIHLADRNPVA